VGAGVLTCELRRLRPCHHEVHELIDDVLFFENVRILNHKGEHIAVAAKVALCLATDTLANILTNLVSHDQIVLV